MKQKLKHIIKDTKEVSLSSEEKDGIKASLLEHIESHPLVEGSGGFCMPKRVSFFEWTGDYFYSKKVMVPSALLLLIVLTGGVSFASSYSLPGHLLYPVKILNEKLSSALAFDTEEKTKILALNALNRLEEAEMLLIEGKLDEKTEVEITKSFEKDSRLADKSLLVLQKDNEKSGVEAALKFKDDLDKHQKILNGFSQSSDSESGDTNIKKKLLVSEVDRMIAKLRSLSSGSLDKKEEKKPILKKQSESKKINTTSSTSVIIPPLNTSATTSVEAKAEAEIKETEKNDTKKDDLKESAKIDVKVDTNVSGSGSMSVPSLGL